MTSVLWLLAGCLLILAACLLALWEPDSLAYASGVWNL